MAGTGYDVPWFTENFDSARWPARVMTYRGLQRTFIPQDGRHELWRALAYTELLFRKMAGPSYDVPWLTQNFYSARWPARVMMYPSS
jgi:hypothetical protein